MGDVGDPRLATAEERITEFTEEKIAETDPRTPNKRELLSGQPDPS